MFADNRGGGIYYWWIYYNNLNVYFATSPTTGISHSYYVPSPGGNYAGWVMSVSALRGAAGLNSILTYWGINPVFPSFSSSFN
jgi:hypothetical protein